jgi:D-alanyl-D-alanine endopeptidase (penicillin-binding protein 7)
MQVTLVERPIIIVLLDSWGKYTRVSDAARIRQWLELASSASTRRVSAGADGAIRIQKSSSS